MRFYGNGVLRLNKDVRVKFSKPQIKYEKGYADIDDEKVCKKLMALGYEHDEPLKEPPKEKKPRKTPGKEEEKK